MPPHSPGAPVVGAMDGRPSFTRRPSHAHTKSNVFVSVDATVPFCMNNAMLSPLRSNGNDGSGDEKKPTFDDETVTRTRELRNCLVVHTCHVDDAHVRSKLVSAIQGNPSDGGIDEKTQQLSRRLSMLVAAEGLVISHRK